MHKQVLKGLVEKCLKNRSTDSPDRNYMSLEQMEDVVCELSQQLTEAQEYRAFHDETYETMVQRAEKAEAQVVLSNQQRDNWMESNARRTEQVDALEQENKRLRDTMERIANGYHGCDIELAEQALKEVE